MDLIGYSQCYFQKSCIIIELCCRAAWLRASKWIDVEANELTPDNLIEILNDAAQRRRLLKAIQKEQGSHLPLHWRYEEVAVSCKATPDELRHIVKGLLQSKSRTEYLLRDLVRHPQMPEDMLMLLCERRRCIDDLGHLPGPRSILERVAEKYKYSEAITTLALKYYGADDYDNEQFATFLRKHADDSMLKGNITRSKKLSSEKWQIVQEVFQEDNRK